MRPHITFGAICDADTAPLFNLDIRGRLGETLRDAWQDGAANAALHGITVPGVPNMFLVQRSQRLSLMANFLFGIVIEGEIELELDGGETVRLSAGDVVVQRGTIHTWRNVGTVPSKMIFVLLDADPVVIGGEPLEPGVRALVTAS